MRPIWGSCRPASRPPWPSAAWRSCQRSTSTKRDSARRARGGEQCRQRPEQRVELQVGMEEAADEAGLPAVAAMAHDGDLLGRWPRVDLVDRDRCERRVARHHVLVAAGEDHHVAGLDPDRRQRADNHPAAALDTDMERRDRPLGHLQAGCQHRRRRGREGPGLGELADEMDRPGQAHDAQDFRQDVQGRLPMAQRRIGRCLAVSPQASRMPHRSSRAGAIRQSR